MPLIQNLFKYKESKIISRKIAALLQAFGLSVGFVRACKCAAMWLEVHSFLRVGRKKQNKFHQICSNLSKSKIPRLRFYQFISNLSVCRVVIHSLVANGCGYEMERIAEMRLYPPIQNLMRDETLENPLKPLYFIPVVMGWALFIF
jgi:hypothetical protein